MSFPGRTSGRNRGRIRPGLRHRGAKWPRERDAQMRHRRGTIAAPPLVPGLSRYRREAGGHTRYRPPVPQGCLSGLIAAARRGRVSTVTPVHTLRRRTGRPVAMADEHVPEVGELGWGPKGCRLSRRSHAGVGEVCDIPSSREDRERPTCTLPCSRKRASELPCLYEWDATSDRWRNDSDRATSRGSHDKWTLWPATGSIHTMPW